METIERLLAAIETGEVLKVSYLGGSAPGATREIAPIQVMGDKVSARCYTSNAVKTFVISKITILDGDIPSSSPTWQPKQHQQPLYSTLDGVFQSNLDTWAQLGWHVNREENAISLHRKRKNGTPLKGSDVSLNYEEYASDIVMGLDGELREENIRKRVRPWVVRGKNKGTATLGSLDGAFEVFQKYAQELSPNKS
ncbi:hypothetical protein [Dokdonella sp.]|uniref:hypothetical protein n=1 Tax=Dokdonella sp. TaxID=2291710 RepID=UPI0025BC6F6A|nr:hypothetical protein [Dokdonella sp.]MBX3691633.1 hypothetical protein [Dokdonella sp.]